MEQAELIGRNIEQQLLEETYQSSDAELVVVYGRRRVGKTWLIRKYFQKQMAFEFTGQIEGAANVQLENFNRKLSELLGLQIPQMPPGDWPEALNRLKYYLEPLLSKKKQVIFFDEFPWIDSHKSGFLSAFDYFWNDWASKQNNLKVIICGSAASWMIRKVIRNRGGLHNRVTRKIRLLPFTLAETEAFLKSRRIRLERYQIAQLYMVMGGIPHYLKELRPGESFEQTIDRICFNKDGLLTGEFEVVYGSLFHKFESHVAIVKALASRKSGFTRSELIAKTKLSSGGTTSLVLQELEESGFISGYVPFDKRKKDIVYKLADEFTIFYFHFMVRKQLQSWATYSNSTSWKSWSGFAFEAICHKHIHRMKLKLGISGIQTQVSAWRNEDTQIDLLIDRADNCINLCEMKFYDGPFTLHKKYADELQRKATNFKEATKTRKSLFITLVTSFGLKENEYRLSRVQSEILLEDLFG